MRSSGERTHVYLSSYISIVTARPLSPQEGARSRSPQLNAGEEKTEAEGLEEFTSRMLEHYGASVSEVADNTEARSQ